VDAQRGGGAFTWPPVGTRLGHTRGALHGHEHPQPAPSRPRLSHVLTCMPAAAVDIARFTLKLLGFLVSPHQGVVGARDEQHAVVGHSRITTFTLLCGPCRPAFSSER
jgi:hypothetical protein